MQGESEVAGDGEMGEEGEVLEDETHGPALRRKPARVLASDLDPARRRSLETGDRAQHRGLAAAARSEQAAELARPELERYAAQDLVFPEAEVKPLDAKQGRSGHRLSASGRRRNPSSPVARRRPRTCRAGSDSRCSRHAPTRRR